MNVLRRLSGCDWDWNRNRNIMRNTYIALICSVLLYGVSASGLGCRVICKMYRCAPIWSGVSETYG